MDQRDNFGDLLIESLQDAVAFKRGQLKARTRVVETTARDASVDKPPVYDSERVRAVRTKLALSQCVFAAALAVSERTVEAWEQGKRVPEGATCRLLELAEDHPEVLMAKVHPRGQTSLYMRNATARPQPRTKR